MVDHRRSRYLEAGEDMRLLKMREAENPAGISIDPIPATAGEEVTFLYYGLLAEHGADQVYMHYGYGDSKNWQNVNCIRMERTGRGWAKTLKLEDASRLNFCFKDSANNWDNNNGLNWSIEIHNGRQM